MFKPNDRINDQFLVQNQFAGGMGVVYIVIDDVSKKRLAIKTLNDRLAHDRMAVERFEREARCWINLGQHQNVVHALTFSRGQMPILLLEFIDGPTLGQLIKSEPRGMDFVQTVEIAMQISEGLRYAHTCQMPNGSPGVIHRDIKPANILLSRAGVPKLSDFGLAKSQNDTSLKTGLVGTWVYMSPEQSQNSRDVTEKTDIFSLGIVLYEMITGIRPQRHQSILDFHPNADRDLIGIVESCLNPNPNDRPTAAELFIALSRIQAKLKSGSSACKKCGYRGRKEHLYCPVCGVDCEVLEEGQWRCVCRRLNGDDFKFCLGCGKRNVVRCDQCGEANETGYKFCSACGKSLGCAGQQDPI